MENLKKTVITQTLVLQFQVPDQRSQCLPQGSSRGGKTWIFQKPASAIYIEYPQQN